MGHDRLGVFSQYDGNHIEPARRLLHALLSQPGLRRLCDAALLRFRYGFLWTSESETRAGFYFDEHDLPLPGPWVGSGRQCAAYHIQLQAPEPVIALENAVPDRFQIRRGDVFSPAAYVFSMSGHKDALIKSTSISASLSCVKNDMTASLKPSKNTADSGRLGCEAPFGRQTSARWLCHSSLCGACRIASSFLASARLSASESLRT